MAAASARVAVPVGSTRFALLPVKMPLVQPQLMASAAHAAIWLRSANSGTVSPALEVFRPFFAASLQRMVTSSYRVMFLDGPNSVLLTPLTTPLVAAQRTASP